MRDELLAEMRDVLLVGHMPHIADLARLMAPGAVPLLNGLIAFDREPTAGRGTIGAKPQPWRNRSEEQHHVSPRRPRRGSAAMSSTPARLA